jgi:hypothetical protein
MPIYGEPIYKKAKNYKSRPPRLPAWSGSLFLNLNLLNSQSEKIYLGTPEESKPKITRALTGLSPHGPELPIIIWLKLNKTGTIF